MFISKRLRFFIGHLSCSILIALSMVILVFFIWYPTPLAFAEGVTHVLIMLLLIDIVVGPLLALIIYRENKRTLKMDLGIIIFVQILAMCYGIYSIAQSRPVWIVQNGSIFQLVRANSILPEDQKLAKKEYSRNGWGKPQWVAVDQSHSQYERYAEQTLVPNLYTELSAAGFRIRQNAQSLETLISFNNDVEIKKYLKLYPNADAWMPLRTTGLDLVVLLEKQKGEVISVVNLRPWQE